MGLNKYKKKRKFNQTPEPSGEIKNLKGLPQFVVQKHKSRRLHYDFRLEAHGVLKSWAVPKGPSLNPKDKRLAMMVEDHPYEYKNFEGEIPKGNYGAGQVIIWDKGTYLAFGSKNAKESERLILQGIHKGHVHFVMLGEKLKGEFSLIKLNRAEENAWLLIKHPDKFASSKDVTKLDKSVIHKKVQPMPHNVKPMLATLAERVKEGKNWIFEIKWDGYRAVAEINNSIKLYSRNGTNFNKDYPEIIESLKKINHSAVIDGEIVATDESGKTSFQALQDYNLHKSRLIYYVFDLLYLDGEDLQEIPLTQRKQKLLSIISKKSNIRFSEHTPYGKKLLSLARKEDLEGIMAKDPASLYRQGMRSSEWLKIKIHKSQEAIICGYTLGRGSRKYFGSLVLGVYEKNILRYVGNCGGGFTDSSLRQMFNELKKIKVAKSPFNSKITTPQPPVWVKPKIVCEVRFTEWTTDGHMRHPIFLGLRADKSPKEVVKEKPKK